MKNLIISIVFGLLIGLVSCEKEDLAYEGTAKEGFTDIASHVFVMNSRQNKGFSADNLKLADFPKTDADFIIIPQTSLTGDVMSPFLSNPDLEKRFVLTDEFDDSKSAEAYFNTYETYAEGDSLQQFALDLRANQVWLIKTRSGEFCKMLILETKIDKATSFVEIKFKAEKIL
jgi:hypothetical protein